MAKTWKEMRVCRHHGRTVHYFRDDYTRVHRSCAVCRKEWQKKHHATPTTRERRRRWSRSEKGRAWKRQQARECREKQDSRECRWCGRGDDEAAWSLKKDECAACNRRGLPSRAGRYPCGKPRGTAALGDDKHRCEDCA